jgi:hypothetical protein
VVVVIVFNPMEFVVTGLVVEPTNYKRIHFKTELINKTNFISLIQHVKYIT